MSETATITVPKICDGEGQPTCCYWDHRCPFLWHSHWGTREQCFWLDGYAGELQRREHGRGTTIPAARCPVWHGQEATT